VIFAEFDTKYAQNLELAAKGAELQDIDAGKADMIQRQ